MADLGNLLVTLQANIDSFNRNMAEAANRTEQAGRRIDAAAGMAKAAIGALVSTASVGVLANLIKGAIDSADSLRDMSQKTGIAVEELSGLGFAAGQAGGTLESMVAAAGKLNKSIADAASGGKDTGAAFAALGVKVEDASGNLKKADVVMAEVADQFIKYQDGPEKSAIALALFGKAGADMIPILNDGGTAMRQNIEYARQYGGQTTELSDAADNFNDTMGKLEVQQRGFANAVTAQVLPVLQQLASGILGASEESRKFEVAAGAIGNAIKILGLTAYNATADFKRFSLVLSSIGEINSAFASGGIEGARAAREKVNAELQAISDGQTKFLGDMQNAGKKNPIEQFVAKYAKAITDEKTLLDTRMQMLNKYRGEEGLSDKQYNDAKKAALSEADNNTRTFYDAQIAGLMAAKANKLGDPVELQGRIDKLAAQRSLVGSDKPAAPRLPQKKDVKSDAEKVLEEGASLVAKLKEEAESYGLAGAAKLEYQLAGKGYSEKQKEDAIAHQANIDAMKAEDEAEKKSAASLKKFAADQIKAQQENAANVEQIKLAQMTQPQREQAAHEAILAELQIFHDAKLVNVQQANAMIEAENARHEQAKADVKAQTNQMVLNAYSSSADQLYSLMQQAGLGQTALGKAAFLASKALAVAQIIMSTNVAAASALAPPPLGLGPIAGMGLAATIKAMGYASAGMTAGIAIAQASAEGGYDIPSGVNPVTQLHEQEMVLPKAQANVIRDLATGGGSIGAGQITYAPVINIDSSTDKAQIQQLVTRSVRDGNADLVERLSRAGRI